MRTGWNRRSLGDLCDVIAGQSPDGKFYNSEGVGLPFYQGKREFGERFIRAPSTWTSQITKIARPGDILMSVRAPVGPVNLASTEICIGRGLAAIRSRGEVDIQFLFYQLVHLQPIIAGKDGAVFPSISKSEIQGLNIAAPLLSEQQRIVGILDEAFEGIAIAKGHAEKNLQNARAIFESYLEEAFNDESEMTNLSDLTAEITDGDHMPPPKAPTGIPFITISNVVKETREIDFGETFFVPTEYFAKLGITKKPVAGDVLYTVTGSFGIPVLVKEQRDFCFQRHIALIRPKPTTDSRWLTYALLSPQVFAQACALSTGTAQKTVSLGVLRRIRVPKVKHSDQLAVADKLDVLWQQTRSLVSIYQQKLAALDALKKSLLHEAFSGNL
jgi:type I restriction enzyme S subunit